MTTIHDNCLNGRYTDLPRPRHRFRLPDVSIRMLPATPSARSVVAWPGCADATSRTAPSSSTGNPSPAPTREHRREINGWGWGPAAAGWIFRGSWGPHRWRDISSLALAWRLCAATVCGR